MLTHESGIHPAEHNDSKDELYAIESSVFGTSPFIYRTDTPEEFIGFLEESGQSSTSVLNDADGNHIGYVTLIFDKELGSTEVLSIAVKPDHQRHGAGRELMAFAEAEARKAGNRRLFLATSPHNTQAINFYKGIGFSEVGIVENYYGDGTARLIMEKSIVNKDSRATEGRG